MVAKKRQSKRLKASKRYKIERKVKEKHRKDRRDAKKSPHSHRSSRKDPGIPNNLPFKDDVLKDIEEEKEQREAELRRQRDARQKLHLKNRSLQGLLQNAQQRGEKFDQGQQDQGSDEFTQRFVKEGALDAKDNSRRAYFKDLRKVIETADVILEVLDARDPLGCRAKHVEKFILENGTRKRIILLLNKIDLVPKTVVQQWLAYLRHEFPAVAFKSSTQSQRQNLGQSKLSVDASPVQGISECVGADSLLQLLKNYSRNQNIKTCLRVGVIGYPNVGKSSVINSLKRGRVCQVGSQPGVTKSVAEVALDKAIKLLDCPGIVFNPNADESSAGVETLLRNCVKVEMIQDPVSPVERVIEKCNPEQLMLLYNIPHYRNANEFLSHLARLRGKLKKGGVPDVEATARLVLNDWNSGKIPFYTVPPPVRTQGSAEIVSSWSEEFQFKDVLDAEGMVLDKATANDNAMAVIIPGRERIADESFNNSLMEAESYEDAVEEDAVEDLHETSKKASIVMQAIKPSKKVTFKTAEQVFNAEEAKVNPQVNIRKSQKNERKKQQKKSTRINKTLEQYNNQEMDLDQPQQGEDYDFGQYYQAGLPTLDN